MKKTVSIVSRLVLLLGVWAAALWLSPFNAYNGSSKETRYGVHEGLELVEQENAQEGKRYVVEDEDGKELFVIPLRGCLLDTRYRNGQLRFREKNTKREGYIDRQGGIFLNENAGEYKSAEAQKGIAHLTEKRKEKPFQEIMREIIREIILKIIPEIIPGEILEIIPERRRGLPIDYQSKRRGPSHR